MNKEGDNSKEMDELKDNLRLANILQADIREYQTYDASVAFGKLHKKIVSLPAKHRFIIYLMRIAAVLLLPLLVSTGVLTYLYMNVSKEVAVTFQEVTSAPGTVSKIILPDRSAVWLNSNSTIRYPSHFTGKERSVELEGEGYFEVESDKQNPFYVQTATGLKVMAHGTKFNVCSYADEATVEMTLVKGAIDVLYNKQSVRLTPDELAVFDKEGKGLSIVSINTDEKTAWKDGQLIFRNATLEEVMKQLSRRYNIDFVLHNEGRKEYRYRASFTTENITQILNYLKKASPIEWKVTETTQRSNLSFTRQRIDIWLK